MVNVCPISSRTIDSSVARGTAALASAVLISALLLQSPVLLGLLFVDFTLRGFTQTHLSPLAAVASKLRTLLNISPKTINAGPKFFAAQLGALFSFLTALSFVLGYPIVAQSIGTLFLICTLLEATVGFCVACQIYPFIRR